MNQKAINHALHALGKHGYRLSRAPGQQNDAPAQPQNQSSNESDTTPRQAATAKDKDIKSTPPNTPKSDHPWYNTLQGWKTLLEVIALPFAIAYAVVTYFQWKDLRQHFTVEQRSWIKADVNFSPIPANSAEIVLTNTGKNPALRTSVAARYEIIPRDRPPTLNPNTPGYGNRFVMFYPNIPVPMRMIRFNQDASPARITESETNDLLTSKAYVAVFGVVAYQDAFGLHWTRFCNWRSYDGPPKSGALASFNDYSSAPCFRWNEVGEGVPPPPWGISLRAADER